HLGQESPLTRTVAPAPARGSVAATAASRSRVAEVAAACEGAAARAGAGAALASWWRAVRSGVALQAASRPIAAATAAAEMTRVNTAWFLWLWRGPRRRSAGGVWSGRTWRPRGGAAAENGARARR